MDKEKSLLTATELANQLQVKPHTVREWARRGLIPVLRVTPKVIRYDLKQVIDAIRQKSLKGGNQ